MVSSLFQRIEGQDGINFGCDVTSGDGVGLSSESCGKYRNWFDTRTSQDVVMVAPVIDSKTRNVMEED